MRCMFWFWVWFVFDFVFWDLYLCETLWFIEGCLMICFELVVWGGIKLG